MTVAKDQQAPHGLARAERLRRIAWRLGRRLYTSARGEQASGDIRRNGEANLQALVLANAPANDWVRVVDIGGNQGDWTLSLIDQADAARLRADRLHIDAFEPVPSSAERFRTAIGERGLENVVTLHPAALSDRPGTGTIVVNSSTGGTNSLHADGSTDRETIAVELTTVDDFLHRSKIDHVHLMKIDTEGHDTFVLKGAATSLAAGRIDVVQFEYNHRWIDSRSYLKDVFDLVAGLPYSIIRIEPKGGALLPEWHFELERFFEANYALVHQRALQLIPLRRGAFDRTNSYA